ncbi:hypothetical protein [Alkaliflexus imshenetskii]|uniref:hypothetical protein n=1 Tax=Alkaliflexus imshenetskii TaxID=286730 RepID=UPI0004797D68|nr:hypothetical protein [Alkaliflexus imshenetskii]
MKLKSIFFSVPSIICLSFIAVIGVIANEPGPSNDEKDLLKTRLPRVHSTPGLKSAPAVEADFYAEISYGMLIIEADSYFGDVFVSMENNNGSCSVYHYYQVFGSGVYYIDISQLTVGTYLLQVETTSEIFSGFFTIQ